MSSESLRTACVGTCLVFLRWGEAVGGWEVVIVCIVTGGWKNEVLSAPVCVQVEKSLQPYRSAVSCVGKAGMCKKGGSAFVCCRGNATVGKSAADAVRQHRNDPNRRQRWLRGGCSGSITLGCPFRAHAEAGKQPGPAHATTGHGHDVSGPDPKLDGGRQPGQPARTRGTRR